MYKVPTAGHLISLCSKRTMKQSKIDPFVSVSPGTRGRGLLTVLLLGGAGGLLTKGKKTAKTKLSNALGEELGDIT